MKYYLYKLTNSVKFDKCGATNNWNQRCIDNRIQHGIQCEITIIEIMEGPNTPEFWQVVGDREWELAELYGYPKGTHYRVARERRPVFTKEAQLKGASIRGQQLKDGTQQKAVWENHTEEERKLRCKRISDSQKKSKKAIAARKQRSKDKLIFTWEIAQEIRNMYATKQWTHKSLAKHFNCSASPIACILSNKTYTSPDWYK